MGQQVKIADYQGGSQAGSGGDDERVAEWEFGLPTADDLPPLSLPLIPLELASAFSISPEPYRTLIDVNRASRDTISSIRGGASQAFSSNFQNDDRAIVLEPDAADGDAEEEPDRDGSGSDSRKLRKIDGATDEADSAAAQAEDPSARSLKRPRLVWTPQLHKRFVDVVAHLGIKNAVPKTIMQLMNVEGLTRENVASHLQKYRLYLKRMQGLSTEGPSSSDQLFASTPVPQSLHEPGGAGGGGGGGGSAGHSHGNGHLTVPIPMPYPPPPGMMPMPMLGMPPMGMAVGNHHGFNALPPQQRDWSGANKYGSVVSYPHAHTQSVTPSDN